MPVNDDVQFALTSPFDALVIEFEGTFPAHLVEPGGMDGKADDVGAPLGHLVEVALVPHAVVVKFDRVRAAQSTKDDRVALRIHKVVATDADAAHRRSLFFSLLGSACCEKHRNNCE